MATNKKPQFKIFDWLEVDPVKKIFGIITGFATIFGLGFSVGVFKKDLESKLELIKAQQEYNKQLETEKSICAALRQQIDDEKMSELKNVVNEIKKMKGGENEK